MHEDVIKIERRGTIAILTFNRPKVLNAFNNNLMERTIETVKILNEDDDVRIIVVQGAGRAFSPGFDLKASAERRMESVQDWEQQMKLQFDFIMQFWHSPKPTIAAVHGYCIAGAFELALACDVTIAAENTRFGEPEVRFGTGIVAMLLPWVTGPKQAKELLLTGEDQLNAKDAFRMGIINRIVPDDAVLDRALKVDIDGDSGGTLGALHKTSNQRYLCNHGLQSRARIRARYRCLAQCCLRPRESGICPHSIRTRGKGRHRLARCAFSGRLSFDVARDGGKDRVRLISMRGVAARLQDKLSKFPPTPHSIRSTCSSVPYSSPAPWITNVGQMIFGRYSQCPN